MPFGLFESTLIRKKKKKKQSTKIAGCDTGDSFNEYRLRGNDDEDKNGRFAAMMYHGQTRMKRIRLRRCN